MWFLPVMFITSLGYNFLNNVILNKKVLNITILVLTCVGFAFPFFTTLRLPLGMDCVLVALFFFHIGKKCKEHKILEKITDKNNNNRFRYHLILLLVGILNIALVFFNDSVNIRLIRWGNPILTILNANTTILLLMLLSTEFAKKRNMITDKLEKISQASIVYLCFNHITIDSSKIIADIIVTSNNEESKILSSVITFCVSILVLYFISNIVFRTPIKKIFGK